MSSTTDDIAMSKKTAALHADVVCNLGMLLRGDPEKVDRVATEERLHVALNQLAWLAVDGEIAPRRLAQATGEERARCAKAMASLADEFDGALQAWLSRATAADIEEVRALLRARSYTASDGERQIQCVAMAEQLKAAIRAITADAPDDEPNGPAESAMLDLEAALAKFPFSGHEDIDVAREAAERLCSALADDTRRLRLAAEAFFGEDFSKPRGRVIEVGAEPTAAEGEAMSAHDEARKRIEKALFELSMQEGWALASGAVRGIVAGLWPIVQAEIVEAEKRGAAQREPSRGRG